MTRPRSIRHVPTKGMAKSLAEELDDATDVSSFLRRLELPEGRIELGKGLSADVNDFATDDFTVEQRGSIEDEITGAVHTGPIDQWEALQQLVAMAKAPEGHCTGCQCSKVFNIAISSEALDHLRKLSKRRPITADTTPGSADMEAAGKLARAAVRATVRAARASGHDDTWSAVRPGGRGGLRDRGRVVPHQRRRLVHHGAAGINRAHVRQ